ncbi:XI-B [Linum grandiflorum]
MLTFSSSAQPPFLFVARPFRCRTPILFADAASYVLRCILSHPFSSQQLVSLLETLSSTEPHYIRCVKPNNLLKPAIFESKNVLQQLRCWGFMEAIWISYAGYPTRKPFDEFVDQFGILAPEVLDARSDEVTACKTLLEKVSSEGTEVLGRSASIIQRKVRSYLCRRSFILIRRSAIQMQAVCRGIMFMRRNAACLRIQTGLGMYVARRTYKELCSSSISISSAIRGMVAREDVGFRRQTIAAVIIQRKQQLQQCAWRGKVARIELKKLKMAARETGALQAAKNKLEKQVEELTSGALQLEKRMRSDLEEAKILENTKLQSALQEMQSQFKETKEMLAKEREAAKKLAEIVPVIQEVPVVDNVMMEKLTAQNENLKAMVNSLELKIDETEKKFEETSRISEERLKQALDAESKIVELKSAMHRARKMVTFSMMRAEPMNHRVQHL